MENFDIAPAHWTTLNNATAGSNFGFSNSDNTGQASGAGEAGGTFARSTVHGYYADATIGALSQNDFIHGEGEFWFGNGATANTDGAFGHLETFSASININRNMLGIGLYESSGGFRFTGLMFNDQAQEFHGTAVHHPDGQYKFSYDWNPNTDTLTAVLMLPDGQVIDTHNVVAAGSEFQLDAFGISSGINGGSPNVGQTYDYFIDAVTYTIEGPVNPEWFQNADADYFDAANWIGGVPNAPGAVANFHSVITADRLIYANGNVTVGTLSFDNANTYLISGLGTMTLQGSGGSASINVAQGTHKLNLPLIVASATTVDVAAGASLVVADPVTVNSGASLSQTGGGTVLYQSTVNVLGGASIAFGSSTMMETLILGADAHAQIAAGGSTVLQANQLNVAAGQLDVQDNQVITAASVGSASNGVYDGVQGLVQSGYNSGAWDGNGIVTSQADALAGLTSIGVAAVDGGAIAMYTYAGDANLDGIISGDDYSAIDFASGVAGASGWSNGDFNYDGVISGDDYSAIDFNLLAQGAPLGSATGVTAVPEPATPLTIAVVGAFLARRRRPRWSKPENSCFFNR